MSIREKKKVIGLQKKVIELKHKAWDALAGNDPALSEYYELRVDIVKTAIQQICHA